MSSFQLTKIKQACLVFVTKLFYLFKVKAVFEQSKKGGIFLFYLLFSMKLTEKVLSVSSEDLFCTLCLCGSRQPQKHMSADLLC